MKSALTIVFILVLTGCGEDNNPLDALWPGKIACFKSVKVENRSTHRLDVSMSVTRSVFSEGECNESFSSRYDRVAPGETKTVRAEILCDYCNTDGTYFIESVGNTAIREFGIDSARYVCNNFGCQEQ